nr:MAG TPA: restriction alleviation protein [Caudoviricetes sp.]
MAKLKPCPFCGRTDTLTSDVLKYDRVFLAKIECSCGALKRIIYSPGTVNKPKNARVTAARLASTEWNRRADNV